MVRNKPLHQFLFETDPDGFYEGLEFCFTPWIDVCVLLHMVRRYRPSTFLEIGTHRGVTTRMLAEQRDKVMDGPDSIRRKSLGLGAGLPTILSRRFATVSGTAAGAATIAERHIAARHIAEQPAERAPGCAVRRIEGDLQRLFRERMI